MLHTLLHWLGSNWLELFSVASALLYLYFSIGQRIWLWPVGMLTSGLYVYVFARERLYADMGLNMYYVAISAFGWYRWLGGQQTNATQNLPIARVSARLWLYLTGAGAMLYLLVAGMLWWVPVWLGMPPAELVLLDAFTTTVGIVATWMLTQKHLEQWLLWVVANTVSLGMYLYKDMYPTAALFVVYTGMAAVGYRTWHKAWSQQTRT